MHFRYDVATLPFYSSGGDLFIVYGKAGRRWTLGGGGVVVSYDNAVPWTLLLPSVVEWWPQIEGCEGEVRCHVFTKKQ